MINNKHRILLFTDWYHPGYKAGGPIQSCRNLVRTLGSEFSFYVFTSDADLGENHPYDGIKNSQWLISELGEKVYYAAKDGVSYRLIRSLAKQIKPDIVYFNSMFSYRFTILPLIVLRFSRYRGKVVLAPRGMLQAGALSFKTRKKKLFLGIFKMLGFDERLTFHATDGQELKDIVSLFPRAQVHLAENIPTAGTDFPPAIVKSTESLKLFFLSRLHPKKNLHYILDLLADTAWRGKIVVDIYGEAESDDYLRTCQKLASSLPGQITVRFLGGIPHDKMQQQMPQYHALVLPTLGENFGHAIFESMISGVPVLISDQTPWRDLEAAHAGWDIPLSMPEKFSEKIAELLAMDQTQHQLWREGARKKAEDFLKRADFKTKYLKLFR